jgi:hypothetical protein
MSSISFAEIMTAPGDCAFASVAGLPPAARTCNIAQAGAAVLGQISVQAFPELTRKAQISTEGSREDAGDPERGIPAVLGWFEKYL